MSTDTSQATGDDTTQRPELHGEIKDYRQPLVTSLGIILGFLLSYLGGWANQSAVTGHGMFENGTDVAIFATIVLAVTLMIVVLYRMLNPRIRKEPLEYYLHTVQLYVGAIVVAFGGFLIAWIL